MKAQLLLTPPHRKFNRPVTDVSTPTFALMRHWINGAFHINTIRLMVDIMGERRK